MNIKMEIRHISFIAIFIVEQFLLEVLSTNVALYGLSKFKKALRVFLEDAETQ
jgi:hypothetical protein